ncbi:MULTISPECIES: outer membrane protein assembly factor BamD [unclassified Sphingomonas]|uniref:outer membrane protein assembly factor BamD n=1 Tax=unclassified Sphingomonas TaxID=196159 RepID=UPI0006F9AB60|nr:MULTISPECIES: outer membrane protein assembly factor BamD [unclassified Sphingomonas]KQN00268.1 transporter [Sphingomonas sp. Leaf25]KQN36629.1 transporter [Sphingomonas sp. Leaf42]KQT27251.1 transporter [Sphingomonas sp. Leaf407]
MRIVPFRASALVLVAIAGAGLSGCARGGAGAGRDLPYVARDVGTLYTAAKSRLDRRQYKVAAALFDEVERQHPYSVWARRAQLMGAFSYYLDADYTKAIAGAQRFLSVHPGNRDAPYAYYLIALSYYEQISDVTRDQKITMQAMDSLGELSRRYPSTPYAADARLKLDLVRDHLAGKEMEIGRFYQQRGQWLAAQVRFRSVVDQYQTTTHAPEALMRLTETYLALGVPGEAKKSAAVLGANYPGTDWYQRAYDLIGDKTPPPPKPIPIRTAPPPPPLKGTVTVEPGDAPDATIAPPVGTTTPPATPPASTPSPNGPTSGN